MVIVEKIRKAIFSIKSAKALEEDAMLAIFFQKNWDVVGENMCKFVKKRHFQGEVWMMLIKFS